MTLVYNGGVSAGASIAPLKQAADLDLDALASRAISSTGWHRSSGFYN